MTIKKNEQDRETVPEGDFHYTAEDTRSSNQSVPSGEFYGFYAKDIPKPQDPRDLTVDSKRSYLANLGVGGILDMRESEVGNIYTEAFNYYQEHRDEISGNVGLLGDKRFRVGDITGLIKARNFKGIGHPKDNKRDNGNIQKEDFNFEIDWPYAQELVPEEDYADIHINIKGKDYWMSIATIDFINSRMEHYQESGENAGGSYFCGKNMVVVKRIDQDTVRRTLEDFIERGDILEFASQL